MSRTFDRARRRRTLRRIIGRREESELLVLSEAERRLRPIERRRLGIRAIPLASVVGTDSRGRDFDRDFLPRRAEVVDRWQRVERAFPDGAFPPIVVYRIGDAHFVLDGHHRVAIARQRGMETIDADVTELVARWHLAADADPVALIHGEQQRIFMEESGLDRSRPRADIRFSKPSGYIELLENVQIHGYHLMRRDGRALPDAEIAADWYDRVFRPVAESVHATGMAEQHPGATDADLFLWLYQRRRQAFPDCGCPPLEKLAGAAAEEGGRRRGRRGPGPVT